MILLLVVTCTPTPTPLCTSPAPGWVPWYPVSLTCRPAALRSLTTPSPATRYGLNPPQRAPHTAPGAHTPPVDSTILPVRPWITGRQETAATPTRWTSAAETSTACLGPSAAPTPARTLLMLHHSCPSCPRLGAEDLSTTRCSTPCRAGARPWFEDPMEVSKKHG